MHFESQNQLVQLVALTGPIRDLIHVRPILIHRRIRVLSDLTQLVKANISSISVEYLCGWLFRVNGFKARILLPVECVSRKQNSPLLWGPSYRHSLLHSFGTLDLRSMNAPGSNLDGEVDCVSKTPADLL